MADLMKCLQITEPGKAEVIALLIPEPEPGEALVKVLSVTTCPHWDLHIVGGEAMFPGGQLDYPYTPGQPGHEAFGEVVKVGKGVTSLIPGTPVATGHDSGPTQQGCYSQYVSLPVENLIKIPTDLSAEAVTSLELAMCVQVSFDQLVERNAVEGKRFAVSGLGPAGLVAVQMAKCYGAREIVSIDPFEDRHALAIELGADTAVSPDETEHLPGRFTDQAFDSALDCTGLKQSIEYLMSRTKNTVAIFGVLRESVAFGPEQWYRGFALLGYGSHNL
jgi:threonine 3-dehydrogenase